MKSGDYWGATLAIRYCTRILDRADLTQMLAAAEKKSYLKDANDPKADAETRIGAIQWLLTHHPEDGEKLRGRIPKLQATADRERRRAIAQQAEAERRRKKSEGVRIGMTQNDVIASSWGKPRKINRTTTARAVREQWVYDGGYLYFDDGVLTAIQN